MLLKQAQFHLTQTLEYLCWSFTLKHILRPGLGPNLQSISSVLLTVVVESRLLAFYSMISQEPLTWCLSSAILLPHCLPPYRSVTAKPQTPYYKTQIIICQAICWPTFLLFLQCVNLILWNNFLVKKKKNGIAWI